MWILPPTFQVIKWIERKIQLEQTGSGIKANGSVPQAKADFIALLVIVWWTCIKQQQGLLQDDTIPPLTKPDKTTAITSEEKAQVLATHFASKMSVPDLDLIPPSVPLYTKATLKTISIKVDEVKKILRHLDTNKAMGGVQISPRLLKGCADQLAEPLCRHFDGHRLLNEKQFGFRAERSASDLLLVQSSSWSQALDDGQDTYVIAPDIAGAYDRVWHRGIISKLMSFGISEELLDLLQNYLHGRSLSLEVNGHSSTECPIRASVPQGSVLGPLLWNVFFNYILQLIPEASAYADDCTMSFMSKRDDHQRTIARINQTLQSLVAWSRRWQVTLAPEKTQAMLISRRRDLAPLPAPNILLDRKRLSLQDSIKTLGVEFDSGLTYTRHVQQVAKTAAWKLGCIRRISHLLDGPGVAALYKSQVRSLMEYSPLVWSACPPSYLLLLDQVQRRAEAIIRYKTREPLDVTLQPMQHRRNVGGLCVMYKINAVQTPHLSSLRLPAPQDSSYDTRGGRERQEQVRVPFVRTENHLRSYLPRYGRLWDHMVRNTSLHHATSLQQFKNRVNTWLLNQ
ncbi:uncharacterized protein LOC119586288 [Penaeus monodon]|uniref:uncharacterized protein LOC119586288 n=1 Tax=Penaeus monodon TaxID=6687 RepID=UPI0018A71DB2|nr:uncharacterized protein LOC119586288 [Penaeus monodon]